MAEPRMRWVLVLSMLFWSTRVLDEGLRGKTLNEDRHRGKVRRVGDFLVTEGVFVSKVFAMVFEPYRNRSLMLVV